MPTIYADLKIDIVPSKRTTGVGDKARGAIHDTPDVRTSAERDAVSVPRIEAPSAEANSRRDELVAVAKGYRALEKEADTLLENIGERCKDIVYEFDPDKQPRLMEMIGKFFGKSEPKITFKMYIEILQLTKKLSLAYGEAAAGGLGTDRWMS